ncbi:MAG TPA: amino acid adenylation domain-containing protein, partial [Ktedonobacteraceae bacterium]|nr:amino acid adenylation domain-containing protein [Ktedonobacteraceae bacterium]
ADDPSGRALLQRVRESVLNAQAHQDIPFDLLVKELQPEREADSTPLIQVFLTQDPPLPALPARWEGDSWDLDIDDAKFDLALDFAERAGGLVGHLEYRVGLFEPETMARLARHLEQLLQGLVEHLEAPVSTLSLLSVQERTRVLEQWNQTRASYPRDESLHHLFEQQVARTPQACAVSSPEGSWSFAQLNARANQLAHALRQYGVQPGTRVGICLPRSLELIAGLFAILKTGAAYVPLDPGYPRERLVFMQEDAELSAVLTTTAQLPRLAASTMPLLCLDRDAAVLATQSSENLEPTPGGQTCAYLIYTSGSTGQPKGVLGTHQASLNRFSWMWQTYPFEPEEVCCQKTTLGFVDAVWEIFGPLLQGVRLHLLPEEVAKDPQHLVSALAEQRVSRLVLVPSLLRALLESTPDLGARLPRLRYWVCSGEALPVELAHRLRQQAPQARLLNLYGSSEVAADATCYEVGETASLSRIPIGKPIANLQVYVLDAALQPVPIGLPGELYVGGEGLALGYFNRPELTRARFVSDPFSAVAGARLYKTGDQARWLADGTLEYLGRLDQQVKVRGVRIELGEIEAVVSRDEGVETVVVTVREDTPGDQRLVAYLVAREAQTISIEVLRRQAAEVLPTSMVPSHWVILQALPLLPNGKVNRLALPAPQERQDQAITEYIAPKTPLQYQLVEIWEDLLHVQPVGIQQNFFALGGHSLLAVRLMGHIARVFGRELPLSTLFQNATIARLAEVLLDEEQSRTRTPLIPVHANGTQQPFFYLHGDPNGKAFYTLKVAQELGPERPFYLLEPYNYDDLPTIPTLQEVAAAHIQAMRQVQPEGPYTLGGWCNGAMVAYEMAQQLQAAHQEVTLLVLMDPGSSSTFSVFLHRLIYRKHTIDPQKQVRQDTLFFRLLHMYEYIRLWNYRKRIKANASNSLFPEEDEIAHPNFASPFLSRENLHDNYMAIFNLLAAGYRPQAYRGKIAVFLAEEDGKGRRKAWEKLLKHHKEKTTHFIPGTHMTSRTRYAHVIGQKLAVVLKRQHND